METIKQSALLAIVVAILVAAAVVLLAINFIRIYDAFGVELPAHTRALFAGYWSVLLLPASAVAGGLLTQRGTVMRAKFVTASLISSGLVFGFGIWAAYSPLIASIA